MAAINPIVQVIKLGIVPFQKAHQLQKHCYQQALSSQNENFLLLLQHPAVFTVGIRDKNFTDAEEKRLRGFGVDFQKTNRGGLITFHNPGQLIAYPILNLKLFRKVSVKWYIEQLEDSVIKLCTDLGLKHVTKYHPESTAGIWVDGKKICSIGINVKRYVTGHGLALNCNNDLSCFRHIKPCGMEDIEMTSISRELGRDVTVVELQDLFLDCFSRLLNFDYNISENVKSFTNKY